MLDLAEGVLFEFSEAQLRAPARFVWALLGGLVLSCSSRPVVQAVEEVPKEIVSKEIAPPTSAEPVPAATPVLIARYETRYVAGSPRGHNIELAASLIVQPGPLDDPSGAGGQVARLHQFARLRADKNQADAATARVLDGCMPDDLSIPEVGTVRGWWDAATTPDQVADSRVQKTGRTTGHRWGKIGSVVSDLAVDYGPPGAPHILRFDRVLEVHSEGAPPFSKGGDSGSLVLDEERYAVGLLFAGDQSTTYMNPIGVVLDKLGVSLVR